MNALRRRTLGIVLIIAAAAVLAAGYATAPSAAACTRANNLALELGNPATCSTTPPAVSLIGAVILLIAGLLILVPWWRLADLSPSGPLLQRTYTAIEAKTCPPYPRLSHQKPV